MKIVTDIIIAIIVLIGLYYLLRKPRCPVCKSPLWLNNRSGPAAMADDYWHCAKCGYQKDIRK